MWGFSKVRRNICFSAGSTTRDSPRQSHVLVPRTLGVLYLARQRLNFLRPGVEPYRCVPVPASLLAATAQVLAATAIPHPVMWDPFSHREFLPPDRDSAHRRVLFGQRLLPAMKIEDSGSERILVTDLTPQARPPNQYLRIKNYFFSSAEGGT